MALRESQTFFAFERSAVKMPRDLTVSFQPYVGVGASIEIRSNPITQEVIHSRNRTAE
jgi:hypothetical protein